MSDALRAMYPAEGHVIISDDAMLSDAAGLMPPELKNDADWRYFQAQLDAAAVVVVGREGAEKHPNKPGRKRLIFTSAAGAEGWSQQDDVWRIDPARADIVKLLQSIAPKGGPVAVTGGTRVFDWFLERRWFNRFHLVEARGVRIPVGRPVFSRLASQDAGGVAARLAEAGLQPRHQVMLDQAANVRLTIFEAAGTPH
jgi:dihydrofolate reductase